MQIKNINVNVKYKTHVTIMDRSRVEDEIMTIYAEVTGSYTYESQAGWVTTLPKISAK